MHRYILVAALFIPTAAQAKKGKPPGKVHRDVVECRQSGVDVQACYCSVNYHTTDWCCATYHECNHNLPTGSLERGTCMRQLREAGCVMPGL